MFYNLHMHWTLFHSGGFVHLRRQSYRFAQTVDLSRTYIKSQTSFQISHPVSSIIQTYFVFESAPYFSYMIVLSMYPI